MTPEQVLAIRPKVLTQKQREHYFSEGYLYVERAIGEDWLRRLRVATDELIEHSRKVTRTDAIFDLEPAHRPDAPRLRRVSNPVEQHPVFWEYCLNSALPDIVADLVGPDVKFHHSKLNFKWANGGEEVKWHYDISFYPHTNYSPLTVGTYIYDCGMEQGPLACLPGSHNMEPMPSQYDAKGNPTSDGRRGFEYDDANQLLSITATNSWQTKFVYDGLGRRRVRTESRWNGSAWVTNAVRRMVVRGALRTTLSPSRSVHGDCA